jgi:hypothetical protein
LLRQLRNLLPQTLPARYRGLRCDVRHDDRKFFPSVATEDVLCTRKAPKEACHLLEDIVASAVPELIVKLFEMIDVEHKNGEDCLAISFGTSKFSLQRRLHEEAIEELR